MTNEITQNESGSLPVDMEIPTGVSPRAGSITNMLFDTEYFEKIQRVAGMLEKSNFVPKHYRNRADCAIAIHMAYSAGIDPMFLLQNTYVVHGVPGWSGQAIIALLNNSDKFSKPLAWEFEKNEKGEVIKATCFTFDKEDNRLEASVDWGTVTGEGWNSNKKWLNMREQMFCYRSATFFARRHCPDILLGIAAMEEREDMRDITPVKSEKAEALNAMASDKSDTHTVSEMVEPTNTFMEESVEKHNIPEETYKKVLQNRLEESVPAEKTTEKSSEDEKLLQQDEEEYSKPASDPNDIAAIKEANDLFEGV